MIDDRRSVPCNGCTACCRTQKAPLYPEHGDRIGGYLNTLTTMRDGTQRYMLARKADGSCVYLGDRGCTIHDRAPWVCRRFDCRKLALGFGSPTLMGEVWDSADDVVRAGWERAKVGVDGESGELGGEHAAVTEEPAGR